MFQLGVSGASITKMIVYPGLINLDHLTHRMVHLIVTYLSVPWKITGRNL